MTDRSREIDFDAFGPPMVGPDERVEFARTPAASDGRANATGGNLDPIEEARRHHEQVFETPARTPAKNVTPIPRPMAIIWPSRTSGNGHVCVIVAESVDPMYRCTTCDAAVKGNHECWAQAAARKMVAAYEESR